MKHKIKKIASYTLTDEFKTIIIALLFGLCVMSTLCATAFMAIASDLSKKIKIESECEIYD